MFNAVSNRETSIVFIQRHSHARHGMESFTLTEICSVFAGRLKCPPASLLIILRKTMRAGKEENEQNDYILSMIFMSTFFMAFLSERIPADIDASLNYTIQLPVFKYLHSQMLMKYENYLRRRLIPSTAYLASQLIT
jgi:hypothetical protein